MDGETSKALCSGLTLVECLVLIVVLLFLVAFFIPPWDTTQIKLARKTQCASNLKQISTLAEIYRRNSSDAQLPDKVGSRWFADTAD